MTQDVNMSDAKGDKPKPTPEQLRAWQSELDHLISRRPDVKPMHLAGHDARIAELKKLLKE